MTDTIVVGIDDSNGARAALAWAARQAASTGSNLRVVHAYDVNLAWIDAYNPAIPQWEERARDVAEATLTRVAADVLDESQLAGAELKPVEGSPDQVLCDEAHDAVLLVVGSRGRGGFTGLLLGSVSQRLAQRAPCPIVIVPLPREASEAPLA